MGQTGQVCASGLEGGLEGGWCRPQVWSDAVPMSRHESISEMGKS